MACENFCQRGLLQADTRGQYSNKCCKAHLFLGDGAEDCVEMASSCTVSLTFREVKGLSHRQNTYCTSASLKCANRLCNECRRVQVLVRAWWPFAQNWRPRQSYCHGSKWTARHAGILEKWSCFSFFWQYEILRWKNGSVLWNYGDIPKGIFFFIPKNLRFSIACELTVSAPILCKTFNFTAVFHLSFKSLLNSCAKWILLVIRYLVNS